MAGERLQVASCAYGIKKKHEKIKQLSHSYTLVKHFKPKKRIKYILNISRTSILTYHLIMIFCLLENFSSLLSSDPKFIKIVNKLSF